MVQQTAVEYLLSQLPNKYQQRYLLNEKEIIKKAKAMEKEQIINAYEKGAEESWDAEKYYNETYNK
jgi:hypothetical protein